MIKTLLIANRGEIACRIARTARRLGIRVVAIYSEADAQAAHVALSDEAHAVGPAPAADSYLNVDRILAAAAASGADAVHPGYGFLSENADFAAACAAAGLIFVGPPPDAIRVMGDKGRAKALMAQAGVPVLPGTDLDGDDPARWAAAAAEIGLPVLVKAAAGGGGRGMRIVTDLADLGDAVTAARREAAASFGDDRVLLERHLSRTRHVEVQVLADAAGACLSLHERDCSLQRRHQKVLEEAPAPGLGTATRRAMGEAAVRAAQAVDYRGAGTVEFLLGDDGSFHFIEMNTRLQVEHPVTEQVTGLDLVEWQLRIAAGEALPFGQDDVPVDGHAIEVRLYAEDPARGYLPSPGRLRHLRLPGSDGAGAPFLRLETGVRAGDAIPPDYDPMIAKLIVWDRDRPSALARLRAALAEAQVVGVATNLDLLRAIAAHPGFAAADLDTRFLDRHAADLLPHPPAAEDNVLALAALAVLLDRRRAAEARAAASADPGSPWHRVDGWRLNATATEDLTFRPAGDGAEVTVAVTYRRDGRFDLSWPGHRATAGGRMDADGTLAADLDGVRGRATALVSAEEVVLLGPGGAVHLDRIDPLVRAARAEAASGGAVAPVPGRIVSVLVAIGDRVGKGDPLVVLEAMKTEHTLRADTDGVVQTVGGAVGDTVEEGTVLVGLEA